MAHDDLARLQQRILGGAYKSERERKVTSEEQALEDVAKYRRSAKRVKLPNDPALHPRPKDEPVYRMKPIKKPKGFKREWKSLVERQNDAAELERGKK